jgi:hypothetical protein
MVMGGDVKKQKQGEVEGEMAMASGNQLRGNHCVYTLHTIGALV